MRLATVVRKVVLGLFVLGLLVLAAVSPLCADEPKLTAKITIRPAKIDDVADDFNIQTLSGTVELSAPVTGTMAWAEIDFYKNGKLLNDTLMADLNYGITVTYKDGSTGHPTQTLKTFEFALHVIDLDYLKLTDGKAGNNRWRVKLGLSGGSAGGYRSNSKDIPKADFDRIPYVPLQIFRFPSVIDTDTGVAGQRRVYVCAFIGLSKDKGQRGANTVKQLLATNPNTEFAVLSIAWK